jgi:hypothetical protein
LAVTPFSVYEMAPVVAVARTVVTNPVADEDVIVAATPLNFAEVVPPGN